MEFNIIEILKRINVLKSNDENINLILKLINESPQLIKVLSYKPSPGLANIGNTCFHNSGMQLIYRITELTNFLIHPKIINQYRPTSFIINFINLLHKMHNKLNVNESPVGKYLTSTELIEVKLCLKGVFGNDYSNTQEDVQQFMQTILSNLSIDCPTNEFNLTRDEMNNIVCPKENNQIIKKRKFPNNDPRNFLFIKTQINLCKWKQVPKELFKGSEYDSDKISKYGKEKKYFDELVTRCQHKIKEKEKESDEYFIQLKITDYNKTYSINDLIKSVYDPFVKNNSNDIILKAKKNMSGLDYLYVETWNYIPNKYILIQLWGSNYINQQYTKINHHVKLEEDGFINFEYSENNAKRSQKYELIGISYHSGSTLAGGHYTANIKYDKQWYRYDDSVVKEISSYDKSYLNNETSARPYIVLYRQVSDGPFNYIDPSIIPDDLNKYLIPI